MRYRNGKYYNDDLASAQANKCLQIVNPEERTVTVIDADGGKQTLTCMISREGVLMAGSEKPYWNSATFDSRMTAQKEMDLLFEGGAEDHVMRLGDNEGGKTVEVEGDPDAHKSLPDSFSAPALEEGDADRPAAFDQKMRKARTVYLKSTEHEEDQEMWREHHA